MQCYTGSFTVQNNTGSTITNLVVVHTCGSSAAPNVENSYVDFLYQESLDNLASSAQTGLSSLPGIDDYWSIYYTIGSTIYYVTNDQCNYTQSDQQSTPSNNCVVLLNPTQVSIEKPLSAACSNINLIAGQNILIS